MKPRTVVNRRAVGVLALTAGLFLLSAAAVRAGGPPWGVPSGTMPWEINKYPGYRHGSEPRPKTGPPATVTRSPAKYTLQVTVLPHQHQNAAQRDSALVIAHVPEDARVYFDDEPTTSGGRVRQYYSPPLERGSTYYYTVRVVWPEAGEWVAQSHRFPVTAGGVHCIDVIHADSKELEKDIQAALAKLPPEDRERAASQRSCAVQEGVRLGAMGAPVKVSVKGQPVFICCAGCEQAAQKNPDKTLATVETLKGRKADEPPK